MDAEANAMPGGGDATSVVLLVVACTIELEGEALDFLQGGPGRVIRPTAAAEVAAAVRTFRPTLVLMDMELPMVADAVVASTCEQPRLDGAARVTIFGLVPQLHRSTRNRCEALGLQGCLERPLTRGRLVAEMRRAGVALTATCGQDPT